MDLAVRNGRVYAAGRLQNIDLFIKDGVVEAIGGPHKADENLDARGLIVLPGAMDVHVHFREPGPTYKEDWESGSSSAAAGGVTTVVDQPNTDPRTLDRRTFRAKLDLARCSAVVDYCINGGPGKIHELVALGALAIGEIFTYEHSESDLLEVLRETEEAGALATIHAEDGEIIKEQTKLLEDLRDPVLYSSSRPPAAEAQAIGWVLNATKRAHICHLSTGQGLDIIRQGRKAEKQVTCEVTPHHLLFNRRDYRKWGSFLKINPPLREARDNDALWQGLRAGEIDIIASDHAPHLPEEKRDEIWSAPAGVPGVETMLPLILSLVKSNFLSLDRAVDALSAKPAEIFGLQSKGTIARGKDADLVLFDPRSTTRIRADRLHSRAEWTPYEGRYGIFPKLTLVRGRVVYDGDIEVKPGFGKFLPGPGYQRERVFEEE